MKSFRDRVAVITGAGSGIGRALARALFDQGAAIALVDVDEARLREVERELAGGGRVSVHVADVSDRARMSALPEEVLAHHDRVDIVINNAGVSVSSDLLDHSMEDFEWLVGINFWGVVYGCKFFLPALLRSDDAYLVNLSSMFGLIGVPSQSAYCATKFAVRGFSESIAAELAGTPVKVLSVHPGGICTNIVRDGRYDERAKAMRPKLVRFFERHTMPPERCAAIILQAMRRNRSRVLVTREAHLTDAAKRVFPALPQSWIERGRRLLQGR